MNGFSLTWLAFGLVLALFGARAWVVESNRGRLTTAGSAQRGLSVAVGASLVLLVVMMTFNGGATLADLLVNGDPATAQEAQQDPTPTTPGDTGGAPAPAPAPAGEGG